MNRKRSASVSTLVHPRNGNPDPTLGIDLLRCPEVLDGMSSMLTIWELALSELGRVERLEMT